MMNTRAKACAALRQGYVQTAIAYLRGGIKQIAHLLPKQEGEVMVGGGRRELLRQSGEAKILLDMLQQIRARLPLNPRVVLQRRLNDAVANEQFEEAAMLRDSLAAMKQQAPSSIAPKLSEPTPAKRPRKVRQPRGPSDANAEKESP